MYHSPRTTHHSRATRCAFTLIEMLVAMALTLILVYAIAHFYAIIGDSVKDGRGMIEMNQQLRAVTQRLKLDLDQLTIPAVPWADEGGAAGYLEVKEGLAKDFDVNGNFLLDADNDVPARIDVDGINGPDFEEPNVSNLLGDVDDILGMTIRAGSIPFNGIMPQMYVTGPAGTPNPRDGELRAIQTTALLKSSNPPLTRSTTSLYAEVVWWTSFSDINSNGLWGLGEPRYIHRRQLLIRPDLNILHTDDPYLPGTPYFFRVAQPTGASINSPESIWLYDVYQYCDVSIRPLALTNGFLYFAANSLADLAKRKNRFMHVSGFFDSALTTPFFDSATTTNFPYASDLNPNLAGSLKPGLLPDNSFSLANTAPRHAAVNNASQYRWVLFDGGRKGEDVMLSNILAFDIRVFDPDAIVRSAVTDPSAAVTAAPANALQFSADAIQPGDAGYAYAVANNFPTTHNPYPAVGTGAYVDLGYGFALQNTLSTLGASHAVTGTVPTPVTAVPKSFALLFLPNPSNSVLALYGAPATGSTYTQLLGNSRFAGLPSLPFSYYRASAGSAHAPGPYQTALGFTWDSWTVAYERDGVNQDAAVEVAGLNLLIDEGTDGEDNPYTTNAMGVPQYENGIDDAYERETVPPYAHPLRGIQIRIRLYEPGTRQLRQATVESDFISE